MEPVVLETEKLRLLPVEVGMADELHGIFTNAAVRRYLLDDKVIGMDWVQEVIAASGRLFDEAGYGLWALQRKGTEPLIGFCGYVMMGQLQLLYALLPAYQGQGLATEAARAVVDYGFNQAGMTEILAAADLPNTPSFGVMQRLGMAYWKTDSGLNYYLLKK